MQRITKKFKQFLKLMLDISMQVTAQTPLTLASTQTVSNSNSNVNTEIILPI
jgi:hypothetical protein